MTFHDLPGPLLAGLLLSLVGSTLLGVLVAQVLNHPDRPLHALRGLVVATATVVVTSLVIRTAYFAVPVLTRAAPRPRTTPRRDPA